MQVCLLNTSATYFGPNKDIPTGIWLEELATPYYLFKEKGYEVVVASIAGGAIPVDAGSMGEGFFTDAAKKFMHDGAAVGEMSHSVSVKTLITSQKSRTLAEKNPFPPFSAHNSACHCLPLAISGLGRDCNSIEITLRH
jgi:hypothetical protein